MALDRYDQSLVEEPRVRLPYLTRPRLVIGFTVVTIAATVAAFLVGSSISTTGEAIEDAATVEIPVTAAIEKRTVAAVPTYQGVVIVGEALTVIGFTPDGAISPVLVSTSVSPGDPVPFGHALGEVSGRPVFVLQSSLPLYRNLVSVDRGADVAALQKALNSAGVEAPTTGVMDWNTLMAVREVYHRAGYHEPGWPQMPYVDAREIVMIPSGDAEVLSVASPGSQLDKDHPLATIRLTPDFVRARVGVIDEDTFQPGTEVRITGPDGYSAAGTVARISAFQGATDAVPTAGYDIDVDFAADSSAPPRATTPMTISALAESEDVLAVPLIAIRQDGSGTYLLMPDEDKPNAEVRVAVSVSAQADGWAGITSADSRVKEGATVMIR